ncbi:uncharacterized protein LOC119349500 [Triticum dicoccoides]|uniref:uncharacterized protein LOC119349500 n=1 Tax=Triticum dicoccoides TaxID=85692 RepID=UPI00188EA08D|nr:uncharacterized protein LOC119349500 [Triticum dicoccoides]
MEWTPVMAYPRAQLASGSPATVELQAARGKAATNKRRSWNRPKKELETMFFLLEKGYSELRRWNNTLFCWKRCFFLLEASLWIATVDASRRAAELHICNGDKRKATTDEGKSYNQCFFLVTDVWFSFTGTYDLWWRTAAPATR